MVFAIISSVLLLFIVVLYILLALKAPLGFLAWGGEHKGVLPKEKRIQTIISVPAQLFSIYVLLKIGGVFSDVNVVITIFGYIFSVFFTLNVFTNLLSKSKYEKYIMTPIAFIIAFSFIYYSILSM